MDNNELLYPHSADVYERETSDGGFSKGWGMHFLPVEKYLIDAHAHIEEKALNDAEACIESFLRQIEIYNFKRVIMILPMIDCLGKAISPLRFISFFKDADEMGRYLSAVSRDILSFILYVNHKNPDTGLIEKAAELGICGIKLHNAPVITEAADPEIWLSKDWYKAFGVIERLKLPVLWHVTQRLTDSPYTYGGRNSYWNEGWEKGVKYTNEDLLKVFLKVAGDFPGIDFIGAHQLHLGWDRLTGLFDRYANLYTDTSIGCFLRKNDDLYESDKKYIRDVLMKYSDKILFGTDMILENKNSYGFTDYTYNGHIRFIRQLRLPYDVLSQICHKNAERLFKL